MYFLVMLEVVLVHSASRGFLFTYPLSLSFSPRLHSLASRLSLAGGLCRTDFEGALRLTDGEGKKKLGCKDSTPETFGREWSTGRREKGGEKSSF